MAGPFVIRLRIHPLMNPAAFLELTGRAPDV
jgi:hypothetical protein